MPVQIDLGGETHELKLTYSAIRAVEREAGGKSIAYLTSPDHGGYDTMCLLVWGGLRHEKKRWTTKDVEQWLDAYLEAGGTFEALDILVTQAMIEGHIVTVKQAPEGNA